MSIRFRVKNLFSLYTPILAMLPSLMVSCTNTKHLTYLEGKFDTARLSQIHIPEAMIQRGDQVSIAVYSDNPQASAIYNQSQAGIASGVGSISGGVGGSGTAPASSAGGSYLVDDHGNIDFPSLGRLHIEGLTRDQLNDTLNGKLSEYLKNPYFVIHFLNNRYTMLGEVAKPGIYNIPGDHINLLEALAVAGDLSLYGRRDSILVIREVNGKREFARLDITKPEIMASPYFNLQQNDLVYVVPSKKKAIANDQITSRNIGIAASLLSILVILITVFKL